MARAGLPPAEHGFVERDDAFIDEWSDFLFETVTTRQTESDLSEVI